MALESILDGRYICKAGLRHMSRFARMRAAEVVVEGVCVSPRFLQDESVPPSRTPHKLSDWIPTRIDLTAPFPFLEPTSRSKHGQGRR